MLPRLLGARVRRLLPAQLLGARAVHAVPPVRLRHRLRRPRLLGRLPQPLLGARRVRRRRERLHRRRQRRARPPPLGDFQPPRGDARVPAEVRRLRALPLHHGESAPRRLQLVRRVRSQPPVHRRAGPGVDGGDRIRAVLGARCAAEPPRASRRRRHVRRARVGVAPARRLRFARVVEFSADCARALCRQAARPVAAAGGGALQPDVLDQAASARAVGPPPRSS